MPICEAPILVGGAGSSGTTLLRILLSRHSDIVCGPELSLFNKAKFYCRPYSWFQKKIPRILKTGLCTEGWYSYSPTFPFLEDYGWTKEELIKCTRNCSYQKEFINLFYRKYMQRQGKRIWAEKTPSNVYCYKHFLNLYPKAKIIHIYRDGRDVLVSMIKKGRNPFEAAMAWIYSSSAGLSMSDHPNYKEIKYEALTTDPEAILKDLFKFLQLDYQPGILDPDIEGGKKDHSSWNHSPHGRISTSSIGKYKTEMTDFDWAAFRFLRVSHAHVIRFGMRYCTSEQIMKRLGYELSGEPRVLSETNGIKSELKKLLVHDYIKRFVKNWRIDRTFRPYPAEISDP